MLTAKVLVSLSEMQRNIRSLHSRSRLYFVWYAIGRMNLKHLLTAQPKALGESHRGRCTNEASFFSEGGFNELAKNDVILHKLECGFDR